MYLCTQWRCCQGYKSNAWCQKKRNSYDFQLQRFLYKSTIRDHCQHLEDLCQLFLLHQSPLIVQQWCQVFSYRGDEFLHPHHHNLFEKKVMNYKTYQQEIVSISFQNILNSYNNKVNQNLHDNPSFLPHRCSHLMLLPSLTYHIMSH